MKKLKFVLIGLVVVVGLVVLGSFLTPKDIVVTRSVVIDAPPARLYTYMSHFQRFNEWSPWKDIDPKTKYKFENRPGTVGHTMSWTSDHENVGNGKQEIVELKPDKMVKTKLMFEGQGDPAYAVFLLEKELAYTKVTWSMEADMGWNPIARYMGFMMDKWVGDDYEKGLAKLKKVAEQK